MQSSMSLLCKLPVQLSSEEAKELDLLITAGAPDHPCSPQQVEGQASDCLSMQAWSQSTMPDNAVW